MPDSLIASEDGAGAIPIDAVTTPDLATDPAAGWAAASGFKAAAGAVLLVPDSAGGGVARVLFGLGAPGGNNSALLPGRLATSLPTATYRLGVGFDDPAMATLAFALGAYRFTRYREVSRETPRLVVAPGPNRGRIERIADGVGLARDLINTAANDLGPAELAGAAETLANRHSADFVTVSGQALADGFPMIHVVGAAATPGRAPQLVDFTWGNPADPKVTLVGKGVCFDTGGLDIKPSSSMLLMKKDMGGAASMLGLAHMIMDAGLKIRLRVLIPAVENAISGAAFRPGDVLRSRKGLTVEIGNTDAEGRLVLADTLTLAGEESPELIVDLATLTGAARVALGPEVIPFYTDDDGLAFDLARAGDLVADPLWRLPLWLPYMAMLDSKIADINNAGSASYAGSITGALFMSRFVADTSRWIHADIFAWTPAAKPGRPEGGEAQAIRALYELIENRFPA